MPAALDPAVGESLCAALREQAARIWRLAGRRAHLGKASLSRSGRPFTPRRSACWPPGGRRALWPSDVFPDGRVFAEYQVLAPHPTRPGCFIDAVQVWGAPAAWRGEAVLIELPAED